MGDAVDFGVRPREKQDTASRYTSYVQSVSSTSETPSEGASGLLMKEQRCERVCLVGVKYMFVRIIRRRDVGARPPVSFSRWMRRRRQDPSVGEHFRFCRLSIVGMPTSLRLLRDLEFRICSACLV